MIDLKIRRDAGNGDLEDPIALTIDSRDVMNFENQVKGGSFATLTKELRMSHLYHATWLAARRTGVIGKDLTVTQFGEAFIIDLTSGEESEQPDPIHAGV
jgi:hypothetical protein